MNIKPVGDLLYEETMGIALRKEDTNLQAKINQVLASVLADGTYQSISIKWTGVDLR